MQQRIVLSVTTELKRASLNKELNLTALTMPVAFNSFSRGKH